MEEQRLEELMTMLISSLLKWRYQRERRTPAMKRLIRKQRTEVLEISQNFSELAEKLKSDDFLSQIWEKAVFNVEYETQFSDLFPPKPVWTIEEIVFNVHFLPA